MLGNCATPEHRASKDRAACVVEQPLPQGSSPCMQACASTAQVSSCGAHLSQFSRREAGTTTRWGPGSFSRCLSTPAVHMRQSRRVQKDQPG